MKHYLLLLSTTVPDLELIGPFDTPQARDEEAAEEHIYMGTDPIRYDLTVDDTGVIVMREINLEASDED